MGFAPGCSTHAKGCTVHSVFSLWSINENGLPRLSKYISSDTDRVVSSNISRRAALSGEESLGSIEPEQTAHLPLCHAVRYIILCLHNDAMSCINLVSMAYGYELTSSLRLKSANVRPSGACGEVQMKDETTARCRRFVFMTRDMAQ